MLNWIETNIPPWVWIAVATTVFWSCPPTTTHATSSWTEHHSAKLHLSLRAPAEWQFEDDVSPDGSAARLLVEGGLAQVFVGTDGKNIDNADVAGALRQWVGDTRAKLEARGAKVIEEREQMIAGQPDRVLITEQVKGQIAMRTFTAHFIRDDVRYIAVFAMLDKQFDHLSPTVVRVIDSIRFQDSKDGKKD